MFKKLFPKDNLIKAQFYSTFLYAIAWPPIQIVLMHAIDSRLLAISTMMSCISSIIIGKLWNEYKDKLYKFYNLFLILEVITEIVIAFIAIISNNYLLYYILSIFITAIITKNITYGNNILIAKKYNTEDEKVVYSNNSSIFYNAATLVGSTIILFIQPPIWFSFILMFFGLTIDNIFYSIEYKKERTEGYDK